MVGGAERVLEALCHDLPARGVQVGVGCLREAGPIGEALAASGVPVRDRLAPGRFDPRGLQRLMKHLQDVAPDLVYALDHRNVFLFGRVAARFAGIRRQVCAIHSTGKPDGSSSLGRVDRMLMGLSDRVIAVSRMHASYLEHKEGVLASRLVVIHNGVDPQRFGPRLTGAERDRRRQELNLPPEADLVGIVAALRREKNHLMLLEALAQLPSSSHLVVVGSGVEEAALKQRAGELGLVSRIHWLGNREDVPAVLACLDAVVLSSHPTVETFPMAILEAMAASLPVVATEVGSLSEMVERDVTGLLVPPGDATSLAAALRKLLALADKGEAMGRAGRARVESHFTRARMVDATAALLRELVQPTSSTWGPSSS